MSAADEEFGPVKGTRSLPPFLSLARRTRYALYQGSRVALYTLHSEAMRRMNRDLQKQLPETPKVVPTGPVPSQRRMLSDIVKLFADDLKSVEDGIYPLPSDGTMTPGELISTSRAFFKDVPEVARRRASGAHQEVNSTEGFAAALPRYYRQNFHFQTDGWLSEESARLYDFQVDVLFQVRLPPCVDGPWYPSPGSCAARTNATFRIWISPAAPAVSCGPPWPHFRA